MSNFKNTFGVQTNSKHLHNAFVYEILELGWKFQPCASGEYLDSPNRYHIYFCGGNDKGNALKENHFWYPDSIGTGKTNKPNFILPQDWNAALAFAGELIEPTYTTIDNHELTLAHFVFGYNTETRQKSTIPVAECIKEKSKWIGFFEADKLEQYIEKFVDKEVIAGSGNIKVTIKRDQTIAIESESLVIDHYQIERYLGAILRKHKMTTPLYISRQYEVNVDWNIRFIKIGCSLFSLNELDTIYQIYCKMNNLKAR